MYVHSFCSNRPKLWMYIYHQTVSLLRWMHITVSDSDSDPFIVYQDWQIIVFRRGSVREKYIWIKWVVWLGFLTLSLLSAHLQHWILTQLGQQAQLEIHLWHIHAVYMVYDSLLALRWYLLLYFSLFSSTFVLVVRPFWLP